MPLLFSKWDCACYPTCDNNMLHLSSCVAPYPNVYTDRRFNRVAPGSVIDTFSTFHSHLTWFMLSVSYMIIFEGGLAVGVS